MAHKKGLGSSRNGRDSNPKMLGVKIFAGQRVNGGEIIVRQRGTRFWPGEGTGLGRDHTIFATRAGVVDFKPARRGRTISVLRGLGTSDPAGGSCHGWDPPLPALHGGCSAMGPPIHATRRRTRRLVII